MSGGSLTGQDERSKTVSQPEAKERIYSKLSQHLDTTEEGTPVYVGDYRSRSADSTKNTVDDYIEIEDKQDIQEHLADLEDRDDIVARNYQIGEGEEARIGRFYAPEDYPHLHRVLDILMDEPSENVEPDYVTVQLPEAQEEPKIRVFPEEGFTFAIGSDYSGESKKSFLRQYMHEAKQNGKLPLHAGVREATRDGKEQIQVIMGLSGTGKTTTVNMDAEEGEAVVYGDDVLVMDRDARIYATEQGMFLKTEGIEEQEHLSDAVDENTLLENVKVEDGEPRFQNFKLTRNGRAAVPRENIPGTSDTLNAGKADQVIQLTRNFRMPPTAKLDPEQAAMHFLLGESEETGAGDEDSVGEPRRVTFYNPFSIGSKVKETKRFQSLAEQNGFQNFILNTGQVGQDDNATDIPVAETEQLLNDITTGDVEWVDVEGLPYEIPERYEGHSKFDPREAVDNFEEVQAELEEERERYVNQLLEEPGELDTDIKKALTV